MGSSWIIEGAAMEGIEVIITGLWLFLGTHCYRRTSLALLKLTLTFWCCRICVLCVFPPWGPYLSWVSGWYCALEPPDLCAKYSSCEYLCIYFIVVTANIQSFFFLLVLFSVDFSFADYFLHLLTFSSCTLIRELIKSEKWAFIPKGLSVRILVSLG